LTIAPRHGVLLTIAYEGTQFSGWARQENARTVAGEIEGAIRVLDPRASLTRVASRTDAGVHALGQIAAFDTTRDIDSRGWVLGLARELPDQIAIVRAARAEIGFEPRRRAQRKTYRYSILESRVRDPFWQNRAWRVPYRLNHSLIREAAQTLVGTHDFRAFRAVEDTRNETVRQIVRIDVRTANNDPRILSVEVTGNRFLYRMVRIIVGTLVDIGRGKLKRDALLQALGSGLRSDLGMTAPADGLCLVHVELDSEGWDRWPPPLPAAD
jgi:tRNA pseudouridine38-40 synthase